MAKQYGLIVPNKSKPKLGSVFAKPSIFQDDSDSDTTDSKPPGLTHKLKKQDKINQERAIDEDPTVFQYDEIYDEMDKKRKESKLARKDLDKKPKYISKLLEAAEKRKRENERRIERQVQKERELEGDMYKDKESFVTSAYKKKLEEMRQLDEEEKYQDFLENIGDVRKQGNLDGFYRHLYEQKVKYNDENPTKVKEEPADVESENPGEPSRKRKLSGGPSECPAEKEPSGLKKPAKERKYRRRKSSENSDNEKDDQEESTDKKEHLPSNLDADSDFSIDSSDSEDEDKKSKEPDTKEPPKEEINKQPEETELKPEEIKQEPIGEEVQNNGVKQEEEIVEKKPKIDIWKKRTVDEKFDEAVKRYFQRKAQREMVGYVNIKVL